jgi:hypothetical protein
MPLSETTPDSDLLSCLRRYILLHTKKEIEATLAFITRTRVGTRKWYLGLDQDLD